MTHKPVLPLHQLLVPSHRPPPHPVHAAAATGEDAASHARPAPRPGTRGSANKRVRVYNRWRAPAAGNKARVRHVSQGEEPQRAVVADGGQRAAVGAECKAPERALVPLRAPRASAQRAGAPVRADSAGCAGPRLGCTCLHAVRACTCSGAAQSCTQQSASLQGSPCALAGLWLDLIRCAMLQLQSRVHVSRCKACSMCFSTGFYKGRKRAGQQATGCINKASSSRQRLP